MPGEINLKKTFEAIQQLPLEVSIAEVEIWIQQDTPPHNSLIKRIKSYFNTLFS